MNGSTASASASHPARRELVVSVNWIGDAVMAMPAIQEYARRHPDVALTVLARGILADLWPMCRAVAEVIRYDGRPGFFHPLYRELRGGHFSRAWILPNSFRSAWIPFRAGIPVRAGIGGGYRAPLLTDGVLPRLQKKHQAWEYLALMVPDYAGNDIPAPELVLPADTTRAVEAKFGAIPQPVIGMIPGAARGPAKRWPAEHFIDLARRFLADGYTIDLYGGPDDRGLAASIAAAAGAGIRNLAGQTSIMEWAALLNRCSVVIANDSGGMHLAAALGRPVVALYGITDPEKTGPLGRACTILQNSNLRSRDIARDSVDAQKSLASILPETVYQSAQQLLRPQG